MSKRCAWLALVALMSLFTPRPAAAQSSEPLKPYVVMILDTSGSMDAATGAGPPSCGGLDNRLNHAKCAINRIVNSYGDMVFALSRFRETPSGSFATSCDANGDIDGFGNDDCETSGINCFDCACDGSDVACGTSCTAAMRSDNLLQMMTGLVDGNNQLAAALTDNACGTCALPATGTAPTSINEIWGTGSWTPLGGALLGAHRYWQGLQATDGTTMWPAATGALGGFDPIRNDPTTTAFLPSGCNPSPTCTVNCCASQCRPYITILLTDGEETCGGDADVAAATLLNSTVIDGRRYRIETKPIGFGIAAGDADIEEIAINGSLTGNLPGNDGFYANDEAGLQLAISQILDDAIRTEVCNGVDDDCDNTADEGFTTGTACSNNRLGVCRVVGTTGCRADGAGTQCSAGREPECASAVNGTACSVANAANTQVAGTCQTGVCNPTAAGTPGGASNEVPFGCNGLDEDCDGKVDENVTGCACVPTTEVCDGIDNDCDGSIDDGTSLPCGSGTCLGTRACVGGVLQDCSAQTPGTEVCNGIDDNCDGNADGFTESCSNLTNGFLPAKNPLNNPGAAGHTPASGCETLGAQCICRPGSRTCPLNGAGAFTSCTGEVTPQLEICNNLDDDCDGNVDETSAVTCTTNTQCANTPLTPTCDNPSGMANQGSCVPADCSSNCGVGQLICVGGAQQCDAVASPNDDTCNGTDDDCDNNTDEDWTCTDPDGADNIAGNADDCPCTAQGQCGGVEQCQNGAVVCQGNPIGAESCNCLDDNCNGAVDEGNLCGPGATCTGCQCAFECTPGEFPCPAGKQCVSGYCLADPCFGVTCPAVPGDKQQCRTSPTNPAAYECVSACATQQCGAPNICFLPTGECRPDDCSTFPDRCTADQNCINGACVLDLCKDVVCGTGENCVAGTCAGSCADVDCPAGQRCRLGVCQPEPCDPPCAFGQACQDDTATCVSDPCTTVQCPTGQWCNPNNRGVCEDDPCVIYDVNCADGEVCKGGTCFDVQMFLPDAGVDVFVTTGGGGGCNAGHGGGAGGGALLALGLVLVVRRRRVGGAA